ncbi:hypothetical protein IHE45_16G069800 [Dioscorea alata]|uniref:Uncharacterized protein n=2 Tax=Dioscorea alata TaxID=55571 RepID=A0ACB7UIA0_DIOAL|nr:hypothetical protein IHE45_16G069800 [Dioscorea alata]KAH7660015.1 hypothetical protein IHE45_16G069800 [Dioscorea alata]
MFFMQVLHLPSPAWLTYYHLFSPTPHDDQFRLHLECSAQALDDCLQVRPFWLFLQQVPCFVAYANEQSMCLQFIKQPFSYEANLVEDINWRENM